MTDMNETNENQTVPMSILEAQAARFSKIIRILLICWAVSVAILCSVIVVNAISEETTTTEVAQEADNAGVNNFTHGDYYGSSSNS